MNVPVRPPITEYHAEGSTVLRSVDGVDYLVHPFPRDASGRSRALGYAAWCNRQRELYRQWIMDGGQPHE